MTLETARRAGAPRLPLLLKLLYSAWIVVFLMVYWRHYGPVNFLWVCDFANFIVLLGLWLESPLILSSQTVAVLFIQLAWCADFFGRLLFGVHVFGATGYMFTDEYPVAVRMLSLFHVVMPPLMLWLVWRLGYDRRAPWLQSAIAAAILPVSYWLAAPELNINWLHRPFELEQHLVPQAALLPLALVVYPAVLYFPAHFLLRAFVPSLPGVRRGTPASGNDSAVPG